MMTFIIAIHVVICIMLIIIILIQAGRGGGLVESFSSVESIFGSKTNTFLTRTTAVLSILFFVNCVSLAFLSAKQSKSLLKDIKIEQKLTPTPDTQQSQAQPESTQSQTEQPQAPQETTPETVAQGQPETQEAPQTEQK